ncbi:MAG: class I SAM-dependent methyltransferase, partial [Candidatus Omnitrophica bacterium]|nr:class I SAM-dependent methyltransferase [Candidatus Omnitrophota bacterium]
MDKKNSTTEIAPRYTDEKLAIHWQVDDTPESLERLFYHLGVKTNIKPYFEEALAGLDLDDKRFHQDLVVADIGAGISWSSALLARHPKVKRVYAVDPSTNRLKHAGFVAKHLGVEQKLIIKQGTFLKPNIHEKVDLVLLSGSLHHCKDSETEGLFSNIRQLLKPGGEVLIAGEHYMDWRWAVKRFLRYFYRFRVRSTLGYSLWNLRRPHPFSGDHWRSLKDLERIFKTNGFVARFFNYKGLFSKDEFSFYRKIGWHCYYAILRPAGLLGERYIFKEEYFPYPMT